MKKHTTHEKKKPEAVLPKKTRPMVGQTLDLTVTTIDEEGFGLSVHETTRVRVIGALPGETVRARVTFAGQRDTFAEAVKILRHSPDRLLTPPCGKGTACDGCPLIQMKYRAQLELKKNLVEGFVRRFPSLRQVEIQPVIPRHDRSATAPRPSWWSPGNSPHRSSASTAATATRSWTSATARSTIRSSTGSRPW